MASRTNHQLSLGPVEVTPVDRRSASGSIAVDQAVSLLRRAVADCGYTLDALEAAMGKDRAYIHKVLQGDKPVSLEFIVALPDDVEARFEQLRAESFGLVCVAPASGADAIKQLVSGLVGMLVGRKECA
jgi:hypothetical protein